MVEEGVGDGSVCLLEPVCMYTWHELPRCPFRRPELPVRPRPITQADMSTYRHLRKLKEDGVIHSVPGQGSTFVGMLPLLLLVGLPLFLFMFFVLVLVL